MKIQPSLKLFFIMVMLLFSLAMAMAFSAITLNYFSQGIDRGIGISMREAAQVEGVKEGQPVFILGYHVAATWDDLPEQIREGFDNTPVTKSYNLEKKVTGLSLFGPPKTVILALKMKNSSGQIRFVAKYIEKGALPEKPKKYLAIPHIVWIAIFSLVLVGFFVLLVVFIIRKVTKPMESLKNWAKSLDEEKLKEPIPDFQYSELNMLAKIVSSSLNSVQETLARELQFLSYASHELRTPITVVRANTELLLKLHQKEPGSKKQYAVLERIDRAGKTMTNLTETLLWLSREDKNLPGSDKFDLALLIEQLVVELNYLLQNKNVQLEVETEPYIINAAEIPCRIVLANLIRNAFQHTIEGKVVISQRQGRLTISNACEQSLIDGSDLGFGLGLQLTKKLAGRYGWIYQENIEESCYQVELRF